jgi:hypothetical protein
VSGLVVDRERRWGWRDLPNLWGVGEGGWTTGGDGQGDGGDSGEVRKGDTPIEVHAGGLALLGVPRVTQ